MTTTNQEMKELDRILEELKDYQQEASPTKSQSDSWLIARLSSTINSMEISLKRKNQRIEDLEGELDLCKERIIKISGPKR